MSSLIETCHFDWSLQFIFYKFISTDFLPVFFISLLLFSLFLRFSCLCHLMRISGGKKRQQMRKIESKTRKIEKERILRSQAKCQAVIKRKVGKSWWQRWERRYSFIHENNFLLGFFIFLIWFAHHDAFYRLLPIIRLLLLPLMLQSGGWCKHRRFLLYLRHISVFWSIPCNQHLRGVFTCFYKKERHNMNLVVLSVLSIKG